jgi:hypothetical protein
MVAVSVLFFTAISIPEELVYPLSKQAVFLSKYTFRISVLVALSFAYPVFWTFTSLVGNKSWSTLGSFSLGTYAHQIPVYRAFHRLIYAGAF